MKTSFVLGSTRHGTLLFNRNDYHPQRAFGVGAQLMERGAFDPEEVDMVKQLLTWRRQWKGNGVHAIDCGANIGVHTVEWARHMEGWGTVMAYEAQERVFYALCGNVILNNCINARCQWAAVGSQNGQIEVPTLNPDIPASFGSLEIKERAGTEQIGQEIDYAKGTTTTRLVSLSGELGLQRVDLLKIDVEGMELDVMDGALPVLEAQKPIILYEVIKCPAEAVAKLLEGLGYVLHRHGINVLAVHKDEPLEVK